MLSNALCEQDTNKRVALPRDVRNLRQLELVSTLELAQFCNPISLTKSLGNSTSIINVYFKEGTVRIFCCDNNIEGDDVVISIIRFILQHQDV